MLTKFGITEAKKAGQFAKTKEQKETVFAMLGLMGVPVVLGKQIDKLRAKLFNKIEKKVAKVESLEIKTHNAQVDVRMLESERDNAYNLSGDWDI
jgi:hypothetical protein